MKIFQPKIISAVKNLTPSRLLNDVIAGVIVAIIALPLSIALAIASGVSPELGLYTAIVAGFVIALFGGSNVNISGPTAAFATIVAGIVATNGISGLIIATIMAGIMLILMGVFRFGSLIKYIPMTITTGFTAGIAMTIAVGQIKDFLGLSFASGTNAIETLEKLEAIGKSINTFNFDALIVGAVGLAILILWPKLGKVSKVFSKIPPSIIAVIAGILLVEYTPLEVSTIGTLYPSLPSGFPTTSLPEFSFETVTSLASSAFTIAILAAVESLLSCVVSDGMIGDRHNPNTELIAQGMGNICSGIFGGIPATGAIARTAANVKNGGRSPISGIVHAIVLALFLIVLMPLAKMIPMPIIAAILFMVAYNMSEWRHFVHICRTSPKSDIAVLVVTFVLTVVFDLVVAIAVGLVVTALLFIKRSTDTMYVRRWDIADANHAKSKTIPEDTAVYEIHGHMFFAAADKLGEIKAEDGVKTVIIRMGDVPSIDATLISRLEKLVLGLQSKGVRVIFSHVNSQVMKIMKKSGVFALVGENNFASDIDLALEIANK